MIIREAPAAEMIIRLGRLTPGYFRLLQVSHSGSQENNTFLVHTGELYLWTMRILFVKNYFLQSKTILGGGLRVFL